MSVVANLKLTVFSLDKGTSFTSTTKDLTGTEIQTLEYARTLRESIQVQMRKAAAAYARIASVATPFRTGFARGIFRNILEAAKVSGGALERAIPPSTHKFGNPLQSLRIIKKHGNKFVRIDKFPNIASIFRLDARTLRKAGVKSGGIPHVPGTDVRLEYYRAGNQRILKTPQSGRAFATPPKNILKEVNFVYTFDFSTSISYFPVHEPQWGAFVKGRAFFLQYMRTTGLKNLPKINSFIFASHVLVNGEKVQVTEAGFLERGRRSG